jgi:hypothetical protein
MTSGVAISHWPANHAACVRRDRSGDTSQPSKPDDRARPENPPRSALTEIPASRFNRCAGLVECGRGAGRAFPGMRARKETAVPLSRIGAVRIAGAGLRSCQPAHPSASVPQPPGRRTGGAQRTWSCRLSSGQSDRPLPLAAIGHEAQACDADDHHCPSGRFGDRC